MSLYAIFNLVLLASAILANILLQTGKYIGIVVLTIYSTCKAIMFFNLKHYASASINLYAAIVALISLFTWWKDKDKAFKGKQISKRMLVMLIPVYVVVFVAMYCLLKFVLHSNLPFVDMIAFSLSIVVNILLSRKIAEAFLFSFVAHTINIYLMINAGIWWMACCFAFFMYSNVKSYFIWKYDYNFEKAFINKICKRGSE